jgi:hypothetical protein
MMQRGLDGGHMMMDACRAVEPSGPGKVNALNSVLKIGQRKMAATTSRACAMVHAFSGSAGLICAPD